MRMWRLMTADFMAELCGRMISISQNFNDRRPPKERAKRWVINPALTLGGR
jgi:hypothetical protein